MKIMGFLQIAIAMPSLSFLSPMVRRNSLALLPEGEPMGLGLGSMFPTPNRSTKGQIAISPELNWNLASSRKGHRIKA
jgi:hypothetical protein